MGITSTMLPNHEDICIEILTGIHYCLLLFVQICSMIHGLRIKDGKAIYVSRYVRTSRLKQEEYFGGAKFMKVGRVSCIKCFSFLWLGNNTLACQACSSMVFFFIIESFIQFKFLAYHYKN